MKIFEELRMRGQIAQLTDEEETRELLNNGKATFYIGFDPTADSLHIGHFMALTLMRRLQLAGNRPIALLGCGTTLVGDPSGRTDMRQMSSMEQIMENAEKFKVQMQNFIDFSDGKALMLNNADWLTELNYVNLLREVGTCFSVNNMLRAECYRLRMEKGLSFLEFNYMIMQSYDFYHLYKNYDCKLQCGGDDQWSNILGGRELVRRKLDGSAFGMTLPLLLTSEGKKMGKTMSGALWLDPNKTSPFEFFQYWRNVDDTGVINALKMATFLPLEQINEMEHWEGAKINEAKEILAFELTRQVHGEEEAKSAMQGARSLFGGEGFGDIPTTELTQEDLTDGEIDILTLLVKTGLCSSKSDARRNISQGGILADDEKINEIDKKWNEDALRDGVMLKRGKKNFNKAILK